MSISLSKGGNISLTKEAPGLVRCRAGLGWDTRTTDGADFDLDASVVMVGPDGKAPNEHAFIFYGNLQSKDGSVVHTGDNLTGEGEGDDEVIEIDLSKIPAEIDKLVITVSIYNADERGQNFGMVRNAFVRLVNQDNDQEVVRYDLGEDFSTENSLIFAEVYRHGGDWKFRAVGQGYSNGLAGICKDFGLNAS